MPNQDPAISGGLGLWLLMMSIAHAQPPSGVRGKRSGLNGQENRGGCDGVNSHDFRWHGFRSGSERPRSRTICVLRGHARDWFNPQHRNALLHGFLVGKSGRSKFNIDAWHTRTDALIEHCLEIRRRGSGCNVEGEELAIRPLCTGLLVSGTGENRRSHPAPPFRYGLPAPPIGAA